MGTAHRFSLGRPSHRTPDLVALLVAISKLTYGLHRGEALGHDEKPLLWKTLPYLTMVWSDTTWMTPGVLARRTQGDERQRARLVHVRQQDVKAQLVGAGIFKPPLAFQYMIRTLEKAPGPQDELEASNDGNAYLQLRIEFQVPAAARWLKHNSELLHDGVLNDVMKQWENREIPTEAMHFKDLSERWLFWEERMRNIADSGPDEFTKEAAKTAIVYMKAIDE